MDQSGDLLRLGAVYEPEGDVFSATSMLLGSKTATHIPDSIATLSLLVRLDVFSAKISVISPGIGKLKRLRNLRISGKELRNVPSSLSQLSSLREFRIFESQVSLLPFPVSCFSTLEILQLSNNQMSDVPDGLCSLYKLKELRLDSNKISSLPLGLASLTNIYLLSLENNHITSLPERIGNLTLLTSLSLQRNHLESLPYSICNLHRLESLEIWHNKINQLPEEIGNLQSLQKFEFWQNKIVVLPQSISRLTALQSVWAFQNRLIGLPESISTMKMVKAINLDGNQLTGVPEFVFQMSTLRQLWIQENMLMSLPFQVCQLTAMQDLSIGNNFVSELPSTIGSMVCLKRLQVNRNKITALPSSITNLSNVNNLDISDNQIFFLPDNIGAMKNLTRFDFYNNSLSDLPPSFSSLSGLGEILLYGNNFSSIPDSISSLVRISSLSINELQIADLPEWISRMSMLTDFDTSNSKVDSVVVGITSLPCFTKNPDLMSLELTDPTIGYFIKQELLNIHLLIPTITNLTKLDFSGNQLYTLPDEFSRLTSLRALTLGSSAGGNNFRELPLTLSQMTIITSLRVDNNPIVHIPEWVTLLRTLREFSIGNTQATSLPTGIRSLVCYDRSSALQSMKLYTHRIGYAMGRGLASIDGLLPTAINFEEFHLQHNEITVIPEGFVALTRLQILDISYNLLVQLPEWLGALKSLRILNFSHNAVSRIPVSLGNLAYLTILELEDNPIIFPPKHVVEGGVSSIIAYLQTEMSGSRPWSDMRVMLTGEQASGKTTLVRSLCQTGRFKSTCDRNTRVTVGIDLHTHTFTSPISSEEISVVFWDCGGQDEFQITHPFFFSVGALFLLLWDVTLGAAQSKISEWAALIASIAPGSSVIVVGTKIDSLLVNSPRELTIGTSEVMRVLSPYLPRLKVLEYIQVSNHTGKNITELRDLVALTLSRTLKGTQAVPSPYLCVKSACERIGKYRDTSLLSYNEFCDICMSISASMVPDKVLVYLRDRGVVVWSESEKLREMIFCHPPFLFKVFLQVFNIIRSRKSLGAYLISDLKEQFEVNFPGLSDFVLDIFRAFRLSFRMRDQEYELFPAILPHGFPPVTIWSAAPPLECRSYTTVRVDLSFYPRGLFGYLCCELRSICDSSVLEDDEQGLDFYSASCFVGRVIANVYDPQSHSCLCRVEGDVSHSCIYVSTRVFDDSPCAIHQLVRILDTIESSIRFFEGIAIKQRSFICPVCEAGDLTHSQCGVVRWEMVHQEKGGQSDREEKEERVCCNLGHNLTLDEWRRGLAPGERPSCESMMELENIPRVFHMELDQSLLAIRSVRLTLLCDNPTGAHKTNHPGYVLTESLLRKSGVAADLLRVMKQRYDVCSMIEEIDLANQAQVVKFLFQRGQGVFQSCADHHFKRILDAIDPMKVWRGELMECYTPNSHVRFMCTDCRGLYESVRDIPIPNVHLGGTITFRKESIFSGWNSRYFVLLKDSKTIIRYSDKTGQEEKDRISLSDGFEVAEYGTDDGSYGLLLTIGWSKYIFKIETSGERRAWMHHLKSLQRRQRSQSIAWE